MKKITTARSLTLASGIRPCSQWQCQPRAVRRHSTTRRSPRNAATQIRHEEKSLVTETRLIANGSQANLTLSQQLIQDYKWPELR